MVLPNDLHRVPEGIPAPADDGACDHLPGAMLPPVELQSTAGPVKDLSRTSGTVIVYCYPMTGRPGEELPAGWDDIPGARGCTPQSRAFRDHHAEIQALGGQVFGLSTQSTEYQGEAAGRLGLPFELLSDAELRFARALSLPTFEADDMTLIRRLTLVARHGRIEKIFYPVFPPGANAGEITGWLRDHQF